ncbi:MAG: hypothetical protein EXR08_08505 [Alphaproteobacteria bacterium]|nr:hypothetical protein [Alphaproteobacteria bacterium]
MALLLFFTACALVLCFQAGFVSLLAWIWLSVMQPRAESWGSELLNYSNSIFGALTLISFLISKDKKFPPLSGFTILFSIFTVIFILSHIFSFDQRLSYHQFKTGMSVLLMTCMVLALANTKLRI